MRLDALDGTQRTLLEHVRLSYPDLEAMAVTAGVHVRTLRDWHRERYRMAYAALQRLYEQSDQTLPPGLRLVPMYGHLARIGSRGARARNKRYGNPGTAEGRRRGGLISQARAQLSGARYNVGWLVRKPLRIPQSSPQLAELIGILLGDGQIAPYQVSVHGNAHHERPYLVFVQGLFQELFGLGSTLVRRPENALTLVVSSRALVEYLTGQGLCVGNKIAHGAFIPSWVFDERASQIACLRGLMDTDGCFYSYRHVSYGIRYVHAALCFTSHARPLLEGAHRLFTSLGFRARRSSQWHVSVYRTAEIHRYMQVVGSHNPHFAGRYASYATANAVI